MRSFLCVSLVFLFAATAVAQFGKNAAPRNAGKTADTTQRKSLTEKKGGVDKKGADPAAEADLANALIAAMDTDGDGVVTKIELRKAKAALARLDKENKGDIAVTEKPVDPNAVAGVDPAQAGAGAQEPRAGAGGNNQQMGRIMQYDLNRDGRLTRDELPPNLVQALRDANMNGDDAIDARELAAFAARMGNRMKALNAGADPNGVPGDGKKPPRN